jgi:hypothetical protein
VQNTEKAEKKVEKAKEKEAKLEKAMNQAIHSHDMAVSELHSVVKEEKVSWVGVLSQNQLSLIHFS